MNIELLLKVKAAILAEPLKFDMEQYFAKDDLSPCGTTACIAGHALAIARKWPSLKPGLEESLFQYNGMAVLGLSFSESNRLFYVEQWPAKFYDQYQRADAFPNASMAQAAAGRIDHFISTNGVE